MPDTQPFYHEYLEFLQPNLEDPHWTQFAFPNGCEFTIQQLVGHADGKPVDRYYCEVYFREKGKRLYWLNPYCAKILHEEDILKNLEHFKNLEVKI